MKSSKKIPLEELIQKSNELYDNNYDYSAIHDYKNTSQRVPIICPKHGVFYKSFNNHINGKQGCPECLKEVRRDVFINNAIKLHNNKYDYSKVEYNGNGAKVCIICPIHGEFWQSTTSHLQGCGCPKCANKNRSLEEIIEIARQVHGDKYDYSLINTSNASEKIEIICKNCGRHFWMSLASHISSKHGCKFCSHRSYSYTTEEFVERAKKIHGGKYDYSKVKYKDKKSKVKILCPIHGEFEQSPEKHLIGQGCPKCAKNHKKDNATFIERALAIHGDTYDYSKVKYINSELKVCIICPKHGEFEQTPHQHLEGGRCPICAKSHNRNEQNLYRLITKYFKNAKYQYKDKWLKGQSLDIFIPDLNVGVEYQGIQHFKPIKYFGGQEKFDYTVKKDKQKFETAQKNGVKIFYFSKEKNAPKEYIDTIYNDESTLIKEIKKYDNNR